MAMRHLRGARVRVPAEDVWQEFVELESADEFGPLLDSVMARFTE
jgi:hypothetical protein